MSNEWRTRVSNRTDQADGTDQADRFDESGHMPTLVPATEFIHYFAIHTGEDQAMAIRLCTSFCWRRRV